MSNTDGEDARHGGGVGRVYPCQHCDYVAESIEDRNRHYSNHKVVMNRDEDGQPRRKVV